MSLHWLGEQIDIHGGGNDLIFPHHENEIAQTESLTGKPFARYWVHNGMLQVEDGEKMSKSLGNYFTISDFLSQFDGDVLRMIVLNSGYRNPLIYNETVIQQAASGLDRLYSGLKPAHSDAKGAPSDVLDGLAVQVETTRNQFLTSMDDDFNSAGALGHIFDLVKRINTARDAGATDSELAEAQSTLRELTDVFGLQVEADSRGDASAEPFINLLVAIRQDLRAAKQWALADKIRDDLNTLGVVIEDSTSGSTWHWAR
jgi:cysteinyl-tRNA synthetase